MRERLSRFRPAGSTALWWILGIGLLLRVCVMVFYTPTVFNYYGGDSTRYMRLELSGVTGLFDDNAMPAGYPAFLAAIRAFWAWLPLTIVIQHLLGLLTAWLLYAAVVRFGGPRWAALLPAAVVALSGDHIFLEHGIFTEALWMPLLALGVYCAARAWEAEERRWWLAAAGVALAVSALVRHVSQVLPVVVALWAVVMIPGDWRARARSAALVVLPALVVIGAYFVVSKPIAGGYSGLVENQGFSLYARTAQFADCTKFTPPREVRGLCVDTPVEERPGPFFWTFGAESPLRTRIQFDGYDPDDQALLSEFGRDAILHQPLDYARAVTKDFARFFAPGIGTPRPDSGTGSESMSFESVIPAAQGASLSQLADQFDDAYSGVGDGEASQSARTALGAYQEIFRIEGLTTLLLVVLSLIGAVMGRGAWRAGALLFLLAGMTLLAFPPMFSSYDVRYAVPAIDQFAAGAAFGLAVLVERAAAAARRRRDAPGTSVAPTAGR